MLNLQLGTRIYNHGDQANSPHFGTITGITSDKFGTYYQVTPDEGSERRGAYDVPAVMFSKEFAGNGLTRFVTEAAYKAFMEHQQAKFSAWVARIEAAKAARQSK